MSEYYSLEDEKRFAALRSTQVSLALKGGRVSRYQAGLRFSSYCDNPQRVFKGSRRRDLKPVEVWLEGLPCRRCVKCLQFRQMKWRDRIATEIEQSKRTWFGTLTFSPVHLAGIQFESMSSKHAARERAIDDAAYKHLQQYFKRLRKAGGVFRYFAVFELGEETGRPHYHVVLHETGRRPILHKTLTEQWRSFTMFSLVRKPAGAAAYISKYLTKDFSTRPRSSIRYGRKA